MQIYDRKKEFKKIKSLHRKRVDYAKDCLDYIDQMPVALKKNLESQVNIAQIARIISEIRGLEEFRSKFDSVDIRKVESEVCRVERVFVVLCL